MLLNDVQFMLELQKGVQGNKEYTVESKVSVNVNTPTNIDEKDTKLVKEYTNWIEVSIDLNKIYSLLSYIRTNYLYIKTPTISVDGHFTYIKSMTEDDAMLKALIAKYEDMGNKLNSVEYKEDFVRISNIDVERLKQWLVEELVVLIFSEGRTFREFGMIVDFYR